MGLARDATVAEIGSRKGDFRTVVIDSADWAERLLVEHVCSEGRKKSIEEFGFGKGWVIVAEQFGRFLTQCDALIGVGDELAVPVAGAVGDERGVIAVFGGDGGGAG